MKPWILLSLGCGRQQADPREFQHDQEQAAREAAARGGVEVRIAVAEAEPTRQVQQITEAISAPVAVRPVAVVAETAGSIGFERVARATLEAGVGWVLVSDNPNYLDALRPAFPGRLVAWVCVNNEEIGQVQAQLATTLLPQGGNALVVEGPTVTSTTLRRRRGLMDGLQGSRLRVFKTLSADWKAAGSEKVATTWLRLAGKAAIRPDLLISQNDEMAEGVLRAVRALRPEWGSPPAIGCDGLREVGQRLVREGVLAATVVAPPATGPGVELVVRAMRGEDLALSNSLPVRPFPAIAELAAKARGSA